MGGVTFSYTELTGDNYKFLILDDINSEGYTFKVSPYAGIFFSGQYGSRCTFEL